ncbi:hypothetical protein NA8A_04310 [Nitratireductor indicus C115]|uniref:GapR-like DNA-binding domain-containing protein n=2 Tax=Nitratireductor indicus TaxID=721133 RepID=K2P1I1_9HYPH|nr:hypothetical protein NA8A_04310 [Nitratireductor indicus C115]SFQ12360.1 Uncharacterized conserved protein, UPF0335 family [Nitratireductor indicus]
MDAYDPYEPRGPARERPGKKMAAEADEAEGPQTIAAGQLRAFIERIERVQEDIDALSDDRKEIYAECKAMGFDTKAVRALVKLRKMDQAARHEAEAVLDLYKAALGMD